MAITAVDVAVVAQWSGFNPLITAIIRGDNEKTDGLLSILVLFT